MTEMTQTCLAFAMLPQRPLRQLDVIGGGGALGLAAADAAEAFGLQIPAFSDALARRIDALLPRPGSSPVNPVDVANPLVPPKTLKEVLRLAASDERIDLLIFTALLHSYKNIALMTGRPVKAVTPYLELADDIRDAAAEAGNPIAVVLTNPKSGPDHQDVVAMYTDARREFIERAIPVFDNLNQGLRALSHINAYYERKRQ